MRRGARALAATVAATGACTLVVGVADASAASVFMCVPTTAGQQVTSGGSTAAGCGSGTTAVDASILSHATYTDTGVDGKPTITFSGVNVQIVSGSGSTNGAVNGKGNLIIGYAEDTSGHPQSGSNDLVVGSENGWKSFGEIVGGFKNQATANYATAVGNNNNAAATYGLVAGELNKISGRSSTVIAGEHNSASGSWSGVTGGAYNLAADPFSSISAGCNSTTGTAAALTPNCGLSGYESVSGGTDNRAQAEYASVSGGFLNQAAGYATAVTGGDHNTAGGSSTGNYASVTGGGGNFANGDESAIAGGQYNATNGDDSFVVGGCDNLAGSGSTPTGDCINGDSGLEDGHDVVLGGFTNHTTGFTSSISGGEFNIANDNYSMIGGGCDNIAGSGTKNTSSCAAGGEGFVGGASISGTQQDGTYGLISDGLNFTTPGTITIDANPGQCGTVVIGVSGAQVGDVPEVEFTVAPPAGLLIVPSGITTANQVNLSVCNESSSAVKYDNEPIRVMTFH